MDRCSSRLSPAMLALGAALAAAGCADRPEPAPVVYRGTQPSTPVSRPAPSGVDNAAIAALEPSGQDGRGVVDYGGYSAVVARRGDTVASMAQRVGLSPSALAAYNGLPAGYTPRAGDELILPPSPGGGGMVSAPTPLDAPLDAPPPAVAPDAAPAAGGLDLAAIERTLSDPASDAAGDAAGDAASDAAGDAAGAPASAPATALETVAGATAEAAEPELPASVAVVDPAPAIAEPAIAEPAGAESAGRSAAAFAPPVSGPIVRPYNRAAGAARNDGVDFAASAGAPVSAAADGQVALVSESLGGLKTIVLIRHANDLLTVYGRVDGVTVAKGDRVRQGQTIGAVAAPEGGDDALLHFEVRRGAASVDPAELLPG